MKFQLPREWPWYFGGAAVLTLFLLRKGGGGSSSDVDALARMILAETTLKGPEDELAQIVFIALNRSRDWGVPVTQVVNPTGYRPGEAWSTGAIYKSRFERAHTWAKWNDARAFVRRVLGGEFTNRGFHRFVHPAGMPEPPCASNRVEANTIAGRRCIPQWISQGTVVGRGMFA